MIFVDASVLLAAEDTDDHEHQAALALLRSGDLATLEVALYETTHVAIVRWEDPDAADRLARRICAIAEFRTLMRVDRQLGSELAHLAGEHVGVTLASCDERDLVRPGLAELPSTLLPK